MDIHATIEHEESVQAKIGEVSPLVGTMRRLFRSDKKFVRA